MIEQVCGGSEAGVEGGIHGLRILWNQHTQEEDWVFLLIDTLIALNE